MRDTNYTLRDPVEVAADGLVRRGTDLGPEHDSLSVEPQEIVVSERATAARADSAAKGKVSEPSPVLPAATRQKPCRQIPRESWGEEFRPGSSPLACLIQLFAALVEDSRALIFPLPVLSFLPLPGFVASFS